jgi:hypothetical protein
MLIASEFEHQVAKQTKQMPQGFFKAEIIMAGERCRRMMPTIKPRLPTFFYFKYITAIRYFMSEDSVHEDDVGESPEFRQYLDELWRRLPSYARRAASVPPEERFSVEWYHRIGDFWEQAREAASLTRYEIADIMNIPVNRIRFFELGMASPEDLQLLPPLYAGVLRSPELYFRFDQQFGALWDNDVYMEDGIFPEGDGNYNLVAKGPIILINRMQQRQFLVDNLPPEIKEGFYQRNPMTYRIERTA